MLDNYFNRVKKCLDKAPENENKEAIINLIEILKNIRKYIESKGGKYYFNTKLEMMDYLKTMNSTINHKSKLLE